MPSPGPYAMALEGSYVLLTELAGGAAHAAWAWSRASGTAERARSLGERLVRSDLGVDVPGGGIWFHAASLGEVRSLPPLLRELRALEHLPPLFVTTSSSTGRACAESELGIPARLAPWDASGPLRRFLAATRPRLHVCVETELWPTRLRVLERAGVPAALVSARLSPERWPRYRRLRPLYGRALRRLGLVAPAGPGDRERFLALGVDPARLGPLGSLKWDAAPEPLTSAANEALRSELGLSPTRPWIVLGSVHPGECAPLVAELHREASAEDYGLLVAPRHPERFDRLAVELAEAGATPHRAAAGPAPRDCRTVLLDRMGVLPRAYGLAAAAVLGGTFVPVGGHSPLEAAAAACPIVCGPHHAQQTVLVEPLAARGGLVVTPGAREAAGVLAGWLRDPAAGSRAGRLARDELESHRGLALALARAVYGLLEGPTP